MSLNKIIILYEDQQDQDPRNFGPHVFLIACVFDLLDGERWRLEKVLKDFRPLKGNQNVLRACTEQMEDISMGNEVLAIFDSDRTIELLNISKSSSMDETRNAIIERCPEEHRKYLTVCLLERNVETLIKAAGKCDESLDREDIIKAAERKRRMARDKIFRQISRSSEDKKRVRECILEAVPSFRQIVEETVKLLQKPRAAA